MGKRARGEDSEFTLLSREELEARVAERTSYLQNLMDTMVDVLLRLDAAGRIEMANESLTTVLGYERDAIVGKPIDVIFASPDENERLSDLLTSGEFVERLLREGQVMDVEIYFSTADGEAIPMSVSASVIRENGEVEGIVCVAKNISERKAAEETAEFLHSLLHHDLGNKLQVIMGHLELLASDDPGDASERVEGALVGLKEAFELIELVGTLLEVEGDVERRPISLVQVVDDAVRRHEDLLASQGITIDNRVRGDDRVLAGKLLKELFANLLENALRHSGGSRIELTARRTEHDVTVVIADDGEGIPPEVRDRLFEKGVTGSASSGSGLGTHLVKRIAETYGGTVTFGDAELGGARFEVTLPTARAADAG